MGFLDRLRGQGNASRTGFEAVDLTGDERIAVVGESNYQDELSRVAGPKQPGGVKLTVRAVLMREPDNPYDPNAVAIFLDGAGKVGYLSRDDAVEYGDLLRRCADQGRVGACEAIVLGGDATRQTQFCVWLHIDGPDVSLD
jgi:hypothetical protein